mgnify:FL=1
MSILNHKGNRTTETGQITQIIIGVSLSTEAKSDEATCIKYVQSYCMSHHLLLTYTYNFPL